MRRLFLLLLLSIQPLAIAEEVYRWQDANGQTHFGDAPPEQAINSQQISITETNPVYEVEKVIDGDTVALKNGPRVRLLGINTPEIARRDRAGEPFGEAAKARLKSLLEDKRVILKYDTKRLDNYKRQLAYLQLEDGTDVQTVLLREGLARALFLQPNLKQLSNYFEAEAAAREKGLGIWSQASHQVKTARDTSQCMKQFCRIQAKVMKVKRKRHYTYLSLKGGLQVALKHEYQELFNKAGLELTSLQGKTITVRGWIGQRKGRPYLKLHHPLQIEGVKRK